MRRTQSPRPHLRPTLTASLLACALCAALPSSDANASECAPTDGIDPLRLLRQSSLDLRGRVPSEDEYERVRDAGDPGAELDTMVEAMLESDEYRRTVREYHRELLWSSLDDEIVLHISNGQARLRTSGDRWILANKRRTYRGANGLTCLDQEQTQFDAEGRPVPIQTYSDSGCAGGECRREGFVWVHPYWDLDSEIKVCAYDAQTLELGSNGLSCDDYGVNDERCGCGPNLRRCGRQFGDRDIRGSLTEEPLRIFEWVAMQDLPYLDAFRTSTTVLDGKGAHFYQWLTGIQDEERGGFGIVTFDAAFGDGPERAYDDEQWMPVERDGVHAGVLTTFAFLMRFNSDRGRANRFYTAFYCDPFVPPAGGIPAEEADPPPNLRERDGCAGCHEVLEPAASHWARWRTTQTYGFMGEDVMSFENPNDDCVGCSGDSCSSFCSSYHVTADNSHPDEVDQYEGLPLAAAWLTAEDQQAVATGPRGLVDEPHEQRQVASCAVRTMAARMLGRELGVDDLAWIEDQTDAMVDGEFSFNDMVRRIVLDDRYRSIH